jgi:hypothetical protein
MSRAILAATGIRRGGCVHRAHAAAMGRALLAAGAHTAGSTLARASRDGGVARPVAPINLSFSGRNAMQTSIHRLLGGAALALALLAPVPSMAGDGHDHGDAPAASAAAALPRFAASSELFELVGVLNGTKLTLYLDHAADNAPVKNARLDLDLGDTKLELKPTGEGEFEATLAQPLQVGVTPVTATVTTPQGADLLAGEFDLHEAPHADAEHAHGWQEYAIIAGAAALLAALLLATLVWALRRRAARRVVGTRSAA